MANLLELLKTYDQFREQANAQPTKNVDKPGRPGAAATAQEPPATQPFGPRPVEPAGSSAPPSGPSQPVPWGGTPKPSTESSRLRSTE